MNQLPVSERRGEPCRTSLHGSTVGYKPDPCGSVSQGFCSSNLGMYSTMDTTEVNESFVIPKRQSNSQFRQMISQQVGQLLFNSPLSICCVQIQNHTSVDENKENDATKHVNRKSRRHHSMRENKRKQLRISHSSYEHGKCQPETQDTYSREKIPTLSHKHIYEEIPDISDTQNRLDEGFLNDSSLSTVHPHNDTICKNLGERTPCDGQESSPLHQRRQRTSSVQSMCTVRRVSRSMSMKEGRTKRRNHLCLESDVTVPGDKNDVIQGQHHVGEVQRSSSTRKTLQRRLKNFSKKLKKISSIKTLSVI